MKVFEHITQLLGLFAVIQAYEFLRIRQAWSARGVWTWPALSDEIGPLKIFLNEKSFLMLNVIRIVAGISAIVTPNPVCLAILLVIHVLTLFRWLGSFNGGSDYMQSLVLLFALLGFLFPEKLGAVCLWYITFQLCLSYFKAGWVKVKNRKWRSGEALPQFVLTPVYQRSHLLSWIFEKRFAALVISWVTIIFELLFPVAVLDARIALVFVIVAFLFHLGNAYVFGLNRFVFAWLSAYPALLWCAGKI